MRYIGLDVHQKYCEVAELQEGKIRRFRLPTTREGLTRFAQQLDPETFIALEATGNAYWVYDIISPHVGKILLANPLRTRAIAEARVKTDKLDAEILARLLAADFIAPVWVPDIAQRELRVLLQHRTRLVRLRTCLKNIVHAVLLRNGYRCPVSDLFGKKGREFLSTLILPRCEEIILESSLRLIDVYDEQLAAIHGELCARAKHFPQAKLLLSIPGLDVVSIMTILAEIGDINRFPNPKKLASYAGLVPRVHASGNHCHTGHITKSGRSILRWILTQSAHQAVRVGGPLRCFFERLRIRKGYKVAIVATARKLLTVIWAVLHRNQPYKADNPTLEEKKVKRMERNARSYNVTIDNNRAARMQELLLEEHLQTPTRLYDACAFS